MASLALMQLRRQHSAAAWLLQLGAGGPGVLLAGLTCRRAAGCSRRAHC
jgi:hypothetical protein